MVATNIHNCWPNAHSVPFILPVLPSCYFHPPHTRARSAVLNGSGKQATARYTPSYIISSTRHEYQEHVYNDFFNNKIFLSHCALLVLSFFFFTSVFNSPKVSIAPKFGNLPWYCNPPIPLLTLVYILSTLSSWLSLSYTQVAKIVHNILYFCCEHLCLF